MWTINESQLSSTAIQAWAQVKQRVALSVLRPRPLETPRLPATHHPIQGQAQAQGPVALVTLHRPVVVHLPILGLAQAPIQVGPVTPHRPNQTDQQILDQAPVRPHQHLLPLPHCIQAPAQA